MRKILFAIMICVFGTSTYASVKCLNIDFNNCTYAWTGNMANRWAVRCPIGGVNQLIDGPIQCGATGANSVGTWNRYGTGYTTTLNDNKHCWCKLNYPMVTAWVYAGASNSAADCLGSCNATCATLFTTNATFREAMISNLKTDGG